MTFFAATAVRQGRLCGVFASGLSFNCGPFVSLPLKRRNTDSFNAAMIALLFQLEKPKAFSVSALLRQTDAPAIFLYQIQHLLRGFNGRYRLVAIQAGGGKLAPVVVPGNDRFTKRIRFSAGRDPYNIVGELGQG